MYNLKNLLSTEAFLKKCILPPKVTRYTNKQDNKPTDLKRSENSTYTSILMPLRLLFHK